MARTYGCVCKPRQVCALHEAKTRERRTVRAWAVVCADGKAVRLRFRGVDAGEALRAVEKDRICHKCGLLNSGTHAVVPLTGTFTPRPSPRRKRR